MGGCVGTAEKGRRRVTLIPNFLPLAKLQHVLLERIIFYAFYIFYDREIDRIRISLKIILTGYKLLADEAILCWIKTRPRNNSSMN